MNRSTLLTVFKNRRQLSLIFALLMLLAASANAAVTLDNTSSQGASDTLTGVTTLTWTHTVNSCSNCVLYVGVSTSTQLTVPTARVLSVTYGARTLTAVGSRVSQNPTLPTVGNSSVELYRLIAPAVGTATVTVNFATAVNNAVGGANSFNGVSQTTPNTAFVSNTGESTTAAVTTAGAVAGDLAFDLIGTMPGAVYVSPNASQTELYNGRIFFNSSFDVGAGSAKMPTAASVPLNWNLTTSAVWALGAITIKQFVSTAGATYISGRIRTDTGKPLAYSSVMLRNLQTGAELYTITDIKGRYSFDDLAAAQTYQIISLNPNYVFTPSEKFVNLYEAAENTDFVGVPHKSPRSKTPERAGVPARFDALKFASSL